MDEVTKQALLRGAKAEMDAAMRSFQDQISRSYWGDTPPMMTTYPARYIPTWRERIRWKWRAVREALARAALWLLRVDPRGLCERDE